MSLFVSVRMSIPSLLVLFVEVIAIGMYFTDRPPKCDEWDPTRELSTMILIVSLIFYAMLFLCAFLAPQLVFDILVKLHP